MAAPDRGTIAGKLKGLLDELQEVKLRPWSFAGSAAFAKWRDEVGRWLERAGPFAKSEVWEFSYITFYAERGDQRIIWIAALSKAERILNAAVENLENDWSESQPDRTNGPAQMAQPSVPPPTVQIINQQNLEIAFKNTTVEQLLANIADQVEKESPGKSGWFRKKLREIFDDPAVKDYYGKTVEAVLKSMRS